MKWFFLFSLFSIHAFADQVLYDKQGFARCFQQGETTYFFDWDPYIRTKEKKVYYFTMKDYNQLPNHMISSCKNYKILHEVPNEILRDLSEIEHQLPEQALFSLKQVAAGAHLFRAEKTAVEYVQNRKKIFQPDHPEVLTQLRYDVGDQFAAEVMDYFTKKIAVQGKSCDSLIGTCDFYLCQEQKNPCGLDGYNLSFGYKYCSGSKFKLMQEMKSSQGKNWVVDVFQCLQKKNLEDSSILSSNENKCSVIAENAYNSHPDCYVNAGYCHLSTIERSHIFNLIKKEIFSFKTLTQGLAIIKNCAQEK